MAVDSDIVKTSDRAAIWNDPKWRSLIYQVLVVAVLGLVAWYLVSNTLHNLERQRIASGFGFLDRAAGFEISESLIAYSAANTYGRAFVVGLLNTLKVAAVGIIFATLLGTLVGISRLSSNWLVARLATAYVEGLRNIPVLLQLFVWYGVITVSLPGPREAMNPVPGFFLSNRGFRIPWFEWHSAHIGMLAAFAVAVVATAVIMRWAKRRLDKTGQPFPMASTATGLIVGLPVLAWLLGGAPTTFDLPELGRFRFEGGASVTPEFAALLFGLTTYTAAFIAEIVRGGILAVPHGQTEAALALGLRKTTVLRKIILPQALRVIVPPTTSQYLNLTKNSSLAVAIGYPDLVSIGNTTLNQTGQAIEAVTIFISVYLAFSLLISFAMNVYNRKIALVTR